MGIQATAHKGKTEIAKKPAKTGQVKKVAKKPVTANKVAPKPQPITEIPVSAMRTARQAPETYTIPLHPEPGVTMRSSRQMVVDPPEPPKDLFVLDRSSVLLCSFMAVGLAAVATWGVQYRYRGFIRIFLTVMAVVVAGAIGVFMYIFDKLPELLGIEWTY